MFLDSDIRVLGSVVEELKWSPGITARAGTSLVNHMKIITNQKELFMKEDPNFYNFFASTSKK